jgi:hypothetical protein
MWRISSASTVTGTPVVTSRAQNLNMTIFFQND